MGKALLKWTEPKPAPEPKANVSNSTANKTYSEPEEPIDGHLGFNESSEVENHQVYKDMMKKYLGKRPKRIKEWARLGYNGKSDDPDYDHYKPRHDQKN